MATIGRRGPTEREGAKSAIGSKGGVRGKGGDKGIDPNRANPPVVKTASIKPVTELPSPQGFDLNDLLGPSPTGPFIPTAQTPPGLQDLSGVVPGTFSLDETERALLGQQPRGPLDLVLDTASDDLISTIMELVVPGGAVNFARRASNLPNAPITQEDITRFDEQGLRPPSTPATFADSGGRDDDIIRQAFSTLQAPSAPGTVAPDVPTPGPSPIDALTSRFGQVNEAFPTGFDENFFDPDSFNDVIDSILGDRRAGANQILSNAAARGNLSTSGLTTGQGVLTGQEEAARSRLSEIGTNIGSQGSRGLGEIRTRALTDAASFTGDVGTFDVTSFSEEADKRRVLGQETLEQDIRTSLGCEALFDPTQALRSAGTSQGSVSGAPNFAVLDALAKRQGGGAGDRRGISSGRGGTF